MKLLRKWCREPSITKAANKALDQLQKQILSLQAEQRWVVALRIVPEYDTVDEFKLDLIADLEYALAAQVTWRSARRIADVRQAFPSLAVHFD